MIGSWKVGAQLSTSHSSPDALDPVGMLETVRRVQEAIDLDLLIVGFREAPEAFREFCGPGRPVEDTRSGTASSLTPKASRIRTLS